MTTEEKAKAYDEALEKAKNIYKEGVGMDVIQYLFPELAESEDERIRKWILEKVQGYADSGIPCSDEIQMANKALAWLEEQKDKNCLACDQHLKGYIAGRKVTEEEKQKEPHYTKRNALFDKCVAECDPAVMKEVSDKVDEMFGKEQKEPLTPLAEALSNFLKNDFEFFARKEWNEAKWNEVMNTQATELQRLAYLEKQEEQVTDESDKVAAAYQLGRSDERKQKEQKPISSCDIVPYIDDKIAALQDMWREEKVSFDWDDMKDMIEDVARHFYHKEQKPSTGIYWHAIKRGDKIPCRAYLYKVAYETENNFGGRATIDGLLVPNIENVTCGCDTWYLPADDVRNLPREGLDELQKEQKPNIELVQRSWYMEGYNDREIGMEPKWIIKTGEGGPKHELNPKYGQPLTEQQVTEEQLHNLNEAIKGLRMDGCERMADSLHSLYNILTKEQKPSCGDDFKWTSQDERCRSKLIDVLELADAAYPITKDSRDELWEWLKELPMKFPNKNAFMAGTLDNDDEWSQTEEILGPDGNPTCYKQKPAEWSEEDEDMLNSCISSIEEAKENRYAYKETDGDTSYDHEIAWLKSLRPSWKPSGQ